MKKEGEPPAGSIHNIRIQNIIARGKGTSFVNGHPQSWLEGITLKNIKLFLSSDPTSPYHKGVHGLKFQWAKDLKLEDIEVVWEKPERDKWQSALYFEDVKGLELESFSGRQAKLGAEDPAVIFHQVEQAKVRNSRAEEGSSVFLQITGNKSRQIYLVGNDFLESKIPYRLGNGANQAEIHAQNNIIKKQ